MKFSFEALPAVPPLAWCARIRRGSEEVHVRHGPSVEARGEWFVEGAWDGPFDGGRFDRAVTQVGTGGRAADRMVTFSASTNLFDRIYVVRRRSEVLVSNSLVFVLVESGGELDPDFGFYPGEFLVHNLRGINGRNWTLPARPVPVEVLACGNLEVRRDLTTRRLAKTAPEEPEDYDAYIALLQRAIVALTENAADPQRVLRYLPLATVSRGYDSGAISVLARMAGCREAITFSESRPGTPAPEDNGRIIGERLGLHVTECPRDGFDGRRDLPEAEFCACPPGTDVLMASIEALLPGRLLLTGRFGDDVWSTDASTILPDLRQHTIAGLGGLSATEFRLRVGYHQFPPPFVGAQHIRAINRISTSTEMRPWSVGGSYDRPIARRTLEEAGIPRESFGQDKDVGIGGRQLQCADDLSAASRDDFLRFCSANGPSLLAHRRARLLRSLYRRNRKVNRRLTELIGRSGWTPRIASLVSPRYAFRPSHNLLFRWGFHRIEDRYRTDR